MTEEEIRADERRVIGRQLQGILDDWRCNSTEIGEIAASLHKGERPQYDVKRYGLRIPPEAERVNQCASS